ncbi:FkbM family methyltransferase [Xanthobacteraceae bacterium A53D]
MSGKLLQKIASLFQSPPAPPAFEPMANGKAPPDYLAWPTEKKVELWRRHPLVGDIDIRVPLLPDIRMHSQNDDSVVKELWWTDFVGWELASLRIWNALARKVEGTILDIGGYTGIFSIYAHAVAPEARILVFEAQPRGVARIRQNLALNGADAVQVVHAAVADRSGNIILHYYEKPDIISSVASINDNALADRTMEIPALRLDEADVVPRPVRLVKMDIEGAEEKALGGMRALIATDRPDMLIEANSPDHLNAYRPFFPPDYAVYAIDERKLHLKRLHGRVASQDEGRNYLFTVRPLDELRGLFAAGGLTIA